MPRPARSPRRVGGSSITSCSSPTMRNFAISSAAASRSPPCTARHTASPNAAPAIGTSIGRSDSVPSCALYSAPGTRAGAASRSSVTRAARLRRREVAFVARVSAHIAHGLRDALLREASSAASAERAPGVIILAEDGSLRSLTDQARFWLEQLPPDHGTGLELPAVVHAVASRALRAEVRVRAGASANVRLTLRRLDHHPRSAAADRRHGSTAPSH